MTLNNGNGDHIPASDGSDTWRNFLLPAAYSLAVSPFPVMTHLVVKRPSTPTGPRAWILPVEMPTSAPENCFKSMSMGTWDC